MGCPSLQCLNVILTSVPWRVIQCLAINSCGDKTIGSVSGAVRRVQGGTLFILINVYRSEILGKWIDYFMCGSCSLFTYTANLLKVISKNPFSTTGAREKYVSNRSIDSIPFKRFTYFSTRDSFWCVVLRFRALDGAICRISVIQVNSFLHVLTFSKCLSPNS
jgi:hypothetical protein